MKPLNREESRTVDRLAQEDLEIPGEILMENAGAFVARSALSLLKDLGLGRVLVLAGPGNNGGDGFVAARHLLDLVQVSVLLVGDPARLQGDALANYRRYELLGEKTIRCDRLETLEQALSAPPPPLILDGLFGTGLSRDVEGFPRQVIETVARSRHPVLAIDLPSGLDCDTGVILGAAIPARRTVTFVAQKTGFKLREGPSLCGEIQVAPIGFPPARGGGDC
ncbi:MAG: NAD(P)H-hydrate epimerase [Planctomycetota bacterium]